MRHCEKCGAKISSGDRIGVDGDGLTVCGECYEIDPQSVRNEKIEDRYTKETGLTPFADWQKFEAWCSSKSIPVF